MIRLAACHRAPGNGAPAARLHRLAPVVCLHGLPACLSARATVVLALLSQVALPEQAQAAADALPRLRSLAAAQERPVQDLITV